MIQYIPRAQLEPHPDNPRKDLGDLSELSLSIRKQGLLQNLTVVPHPEKPDMYRIVIGHRRFAASEFAGLDKLPCIIDEKMTYPEQIAVMMSENMQRSDLTIAEKVGGVQMMMDLGMNGDEIAGRTGLSTSTVYRYAKLTGLEKGGIAEAERRGATLIQFAEISGIEDDALRQQAMEAAGTNEYSRVMSRVRLWRAMQARLPIMQSKLNAFARQIDEVDYSKWQSEEFYNYLDEHVIARIEAFKPKKDAEYAYRIRDYDLALYRNAQKGNDQKAEERRQAEERRRERVKNEQDIALRFKEMRGRFMGQLNLKGREEAAKRFVLWVMTRTDYLGNAMYGGIFSWRFAINQDPENEAATCSVKLSAENIDTFDEKRLLLAVVLVAFDRISQSDMTLMDR